MLGMTLSGMGSIVVERVQLHSMTEWPSSFQKPTSTIFVTGMIVLGAAEEDE